ncbi:isolate BRE2 biomphalysin 2 (B2), partial [Biomphalaria glabrata]
MTVGKSTSGRMCNSFLDCLSSIDRFFYRGRHLIVKNSRVYNFCLKIFYDTFSINNFLDGKSPISENQVESF